MRFYVHELMVVPAGGQHSSEFLRCMLLFALHSAAQVRRSASQALYFLLHRRSVLLQAVPLAVWTLPSAAMVSYSAVQVRSAVAAAAAAQALHSAAQALHFSARALHSAA